MNTHALGDAHVQKESEIGDIATCHMEIVVAHRNSGRKLVKTLNRAMSSLWSHAKCVVSSMKYCGGGYMSASLVELAAIFRIWDPGVSPWIHFEAFPSSGGLSLSAPRLQIRYPSTSGRQS